MRVLYIFLTLFILFCSYLISRKFKSDNDKKRALLDTALMISIIFFIYFTKFLIVEKLLLIAHLLLVSTSVYHYLQKLLLKKFNLFLILSPIVTIAIFFILSNFFRKFG
jgi:predicted transcriptional regulator